jgi:hypothetical protein
MLVGWSRLLSGQIRDPFVGRDLLIGTAAGLAVVVIQSLVVLVPRWSGWPDEMPPAALATALVDFRQFLAAVIGSISLGLQSGPLTVLQLALGRYLFSASWRDSKSRASRRRRDARRRRHPRRRRDARGREQSPGRCGCRWRGGGVAPGHRVTRDARGAAGDRVLLSRPSCS